MENVIFFALSQPAIFLLLFPSKKQSERGGLNVRAARSCRKETRKKDWDEMRCWRRKTDEREHEKCVSNLQIISQVGLLSMPVHLSDQSTHSEIAICTQRSQITWDGWWSWNSASFISIAHIFFSSIMCDHLLCALLADLAMVRTR